MQSQVSWSPLVKHEVHKGIIPYWGVSSGNQPDSLSPGWTAQTGTELKLYKLELELELELELYKLELELELYKLELENPCKTGKFDETATWWRPH